MQITKARELGFCFGVRRALRIIESTADSRVRIATLGPIVHNKTVVERLQRLGVDVIDDLEKLTGRLVAISSHGASPATLQKLSDRGFEAIDTTCPIVRSAQKAAQRLAKTGFSVIIYGEANHPEVQGLLGWAGESATASMDANKILPTITGKRVGILSQTTQIHAEFAFFINQLTDRLLPQIQEIRVANTLCQETQKRQQTAKELASSSDLMIVVGGHNSANTRRLSEVCAPVVETYLIENCDEIDTRWLRGKKAIGITAGTSTPDEDIEQVIQTIKSIAG